MCSRRALIFFPAQPPILQGAALVILRGCAPAAVCDVPYRWAILHALERKWNASAKAAGDSTPAPFAWLAAMGRWEGFDGMAPHQLICRQCTWLVASFRGVRGCYHPDNCKTQFEGGHATRSIQPNFRRSDIEVIAFNLPTVQFDKGE
jgi:hypothetical protein